MPREEKFLQHPAQRRLDKHIKTRTMNVKNTGLRSKINVELYRMFIPRDEEFIS